MEEKKQNKIYPEDDIKKKIQFFNQGARVKGTHITPKVQVISAPITMNQRIGYQTKPLVQVEKTKSPLTDVAATPPLRQRSHTQPALPTFVGKKTEEELTQRERELEVREKDLEKKVSQQQKLSNQLEEKSKELYQLLEKIQEASINAKHESSEAQKNLSELKIYQTKTLFTCFYQRDYEELEKCLSLNYDLDFSREEDGKTLLHVAVMEQDRAFVKYLLTNSVKKANANIKDKTGSIPLHYAAKNNDLNLINELLWVENQCISNPHTRDKPSTINELGKKPREYLDPKHKDFEKLDACLFDGEREAQNIYFRVNSNAHLELKKLEEAKDRFVQAMIENKKGIDRGEESTLIEFLTTMVNNMYKNVGKTILLEEQKQELYKSFKNFTLELQQAISIKRDELKNQEKAKDSPLNSPTLSRSGIKFGSPFSRKKSKGNLEDIGQRKDFVLK